jgi:hypothetical protein
MILSGMSHAWDFLQDFSDKSMNLVHNVDQQPLQAKAVLTSMIEAYLIDSRRRN